MKKGFTIVEIIISIGLIVVIGTISIFGFNLIKKNEKEKTLNNMSDEILTALKLYIETNDEAKDRIYGNYEGMSISLKQLENEGLIEFPSSLDIQNGDDYVVAMLSYGSDCSEITTIQSWNPINGPLYICSKSNGSQNLFSVGGDAKNYSQVTREVYYFDQPSPANYIWLNGTGTRYRILYVDKDDSLVLYKTGSDFGTTFSSNQVLPISSSRITCGGQGTGFSIANNKIVKNPNNSSATSDAVSGVLIDAVDVLNATFYNGSSLTSWIGNQSNTDYWGSHSGSERNDCYVFSSTTTNGSYQAKCGNCTGQGNKQYKVHLDPCMKITGGTGLYANPYVLEDKGC